MKTAVLYFTKNGENTAKKILSGIDGETVIYNKNSGSAADFVAENFGKCRRFLFVGAVGIAVRLIAPHVTTKDKDPAVVCVDELGRYVIPVLSGHIGGANEFAESIAGKINAQCVVSTATDINGIFAVDVFATKNGLVIDDIGKIKIISGRLLAGESVGIISDHPIIGDVPQGLLPGGKGTKAEIFVSLSDKKSENENAIKLIPRWCHIGVGCRKNKDPEEFEDFVLKVLRENDISVKSVKALHSIDIKRDESCLKAFCEKYNIPAYFYSAEELNSLEGEFTASEFVKKTTGADNVSERSALMTAGAKLILKKTTFNGCSMAIAIKEEEITF